MRVLRGAKFAQEMCDTYSYILMQPHFDAVEYSFLFTPDYVCTHEYHHIAFVCRVHLSTKLPTNIIYITWKYVSICLSIYYSYKILKNSMCVLFVCEWPIRRNAFRERDTLGLLHLCVRVCQRLEKLETRMHSEIAIQLI